MELAAHWTSAKLVLSPVEETVQQAWERTARPGRLAWHSRRDHPPPVPHPHPHCRQLPRALDPWFPGAARAPALDTIVPALLPWEPFLAKTLHFLLAPQPFSNPADPSAHVLCAVEGGCTLNATLSCTDGETEAQDLLGLV